MDKQSISLDSIVSIKASQMLPNTYSPLRKKFPDQDFTITLRELMQYSISQSDNNACDILIEYAGGIKHINDYIHRLSIDSFNLSETEDGMHSSFEAVYRNWSTPSAMARLLRTADEKELFSNKELKDFLWQTMIDTETGANKLKGMLPAKTVVGHKTGSSDRNADGMKKLQIMMPASLSFPTAGNTTLPPSSWTHTRQMRTMRTSSPAYHAWYMMR